MIGPKKGKNLHPNIKAYYKTFPYYKGYTDE